MHEKIKVPAALLASGIAGMLVAVQSRINGGLSLELGNGFVTAAFSFSLGLLVLLVIMPFSRRGKAGYALLRDQVKAREFPWWALFGGLGGAFFVLSQGLVASVIGVAMFTVGIVAGQVVAGLVIDKIGLGPGGRMDPSLLRIIGTVLVIIAVVISVSGGVTTGSPWLVIVPLIAGAGTAWQSAVNGLVRSAAQSAVFATFVSFVVGTVALLIVAGVSVGINGWPTHWPAEPVLYIGGLIGVVFIAAATVLVRIAGVLMLSMSNVAGQLIASVLLELGLPLGGGLSVGLLIGACVALIAVVIAALPGRSTAR